MPELPLLCPIFTEAVSIIGVASAIWGFFTIFIQIKDEHKITISKRTAAFLLVGIICITARLVLTCGNDQTSPEKTPASGTADVYQAIPDNHGETSAPSLNASGPNIPDKDDLNSGNKGSGTKKDETGNGDDKQVDTPQSTVPESLALPPVIVSQVTLDYTSAELVVGEAMPLLATVSYSDGKTGYDAVWRSSNPVVASVDSNGKVTALSAGTTQITAQASENNVAASAVCLVTVADLPTVPTGYSIRLSADHAVLGESFKLYVEPYEDDVTQIQIYTISPSGLHDNFPLSADGKYLIDTEIGRWQIYASVTNPAGTYMAQKPEDYVEIEIRGVEDLLNGIIQGLS